MKLSIEILKKRLGKAFEEFLVEYDICPECLGDLIVRDGEKVCRKCGLAYTCVNVENRIPFTETRTPTNLLAYGKNLGGTIRLKGIWCLLADQHDNRHLPLRAKFVNIMAQTVDHPKIAKMLEIGSRLCEQVWTIPTGTGYPAVVFFGNHRDPEAVKFSNLLGRIIRLVGAYVVLANTKFSTQKITKACFVLALQLTRNPYTFMIMKQLGIEETTLRAVARIYGLLNRLT